MAPEPTTATMVCVDRGCATRHSPEHFGRRSPTKPPPPTAQPWPPPPSRLTPPHRERPDARRALATRPRLLLLDEVMAGLRPTECDQMVEVFRELNAKDGLTILLIEHVMRAVMALAQNIVVLHHGEIIARGTPQEVVRDPAVLECYLGEETEV